MEKDMRFKKFIVEHPNHTVAKSIAPLSRATRKQILEDFKRQQIEEASAAAREYMETYPRAIKRELKAIDAGMPSTLQQLVSKWDRKRKEKAEERAKRYEEITTLRLKGMSYDKIGAAINPPVSRERIRQILLKIDPALTAGIVQSKRVFVKINCSRCGIEFERNQLNVKKYNYCGRAHMRKYATEDEARLAMNAKNRERFKRPDVKKRHHDLVMARYHRVKHTPEYKAKQKVYAATWWAKKQQDPVFMAKYRREMAARQKRYHAAKRLTQASSEQA